ncbi:MAG: YbbR-like domain-containing protein [Chloroflexota bacterium]
MTFLRLLGKNLGSLLLSFALAMLVWFSAVTAADPNVERDYPRAININFEGQDPNLLIIQKTQTQVRLRLEAPNSVWTQLLSDETPIHVWVDLSDIGQGTHTLDVKVAVNARPVRVVSVTPAQIQVTLETLQTEAFSVTLDLEGNPASGYTVQETILEPMTVTVSGPQPLVSQVAEVRASLSILNATSNIQTNLPLIAYDLNGNPITGITMTPSTVSVNIPVHLSGGYRNMVVKVEIVGQVADGYKLTGILLTPPNVTVFSADPQEFEQLPGYVETEPLDLSGAQDDFEAWVNLRKLDDGVSVVGDSKVLVQVSIAAIESTISFSLPVEVVGLGPKLEVNASPASVDVILSGPVSVLNKIVPADLRAVLDLAGFESGTYSIIPKIGPLPERVQVLSLSPASMSVVIKLAPTLTPTPTATPTPDGTLTPTIKPSPTRKP